MKKLLGLFAVIVLMLLAAPSARAVDLLRSPVSFGPAVNWTGFYVGGVVGYGWQTSDVTVGGFGSLLSVQQGGVTVGPKVGFDYRFGNLVAGVVGDWSWAAISGSNGNALGSADARLDQFATLRARVGFLPFDPVLLYVTGGGAYSHISSSATVAGLAADLSATRWGWTAGAGVEVALSRAWSVNVEYLYADMGNIDVPLLGLTGSVPVRMSTIRLGVAYRF
jgi:outer membrane immunogenic protein